MSTNNLEYQLILKLDNVDKILNDLGVKLNSVGQKVGSDLGSKISESLNSVKTDSIGNNLSKSLNGVKTDSIGNNISSSLQKAELKVDLLKNKIESLSNSKIAISDNIDIAKGKITLLQTKINELSSQPNTVKIDANIQTAQAQITKLNNDIIKGTTTSKKIDLDISGASASLGKLQNDIANGITTGAKNGGLGIKRELTTIGIGQIIGAGIVKDLASSLLTSGIETVKQFVSGTIGEFQQLTKSKINLEIISPKFGVDAKLAIQSAKDMGKALNLDFQTSAQALSDLLGSGLNLGQAKDLMARFNNEALTGKKAGIDQATAVQNLTFAYKSSNSALSQNSGISENWSDIQEKGLAVLQKKGKYLGLTVGKLNEAGKAEAQYEGTIALTNLTLGSSEKFAGTSIENTQKLGLAQKELASTIGGLLDPAYNKLLQTQTKLVNIVSDLLKIKIDPQILIAGFIGIGGALLYIMIPSIIAGATAFGGLVLSMLPLVAIAALVGAAAYLIMSNWGSISPFFEGIKNSLTTSFAELSTAFSGGSQNSDGIAKMLKSLGLSDETSIKIAGQSTLIAGSLKTAWSDLQTSFSGGETGGSGINNLLKGLGLDAESSNLITARILEITPNLKGAFQELKNILSGGNTDAPSLAKVLGFDEAQTQVLNTNLANIKLTITDFISSIKLSFSSLGEGIAAVFDNLIVQTAISGIVMLFNTLLLPALQSLGNTITTLLMPILTQLWNLLGIILPPILSALAIIFGAVLVVAINLVIISFTAIVDGINILINVLAIIGSLVVAAFGTVIAYFSAVFKTIYAIFTGNFGSITGIWTTFLTNLQTLWSDAWNTISTALTNIWNNITSTITTRWNLISTFFTNALLALSLAWNTFWTGLWTFLTTIWTNIYTTILTKWTELTTFFTTGFVTLKSFWDNFWQGISDKITEIWTGIVTAISTKSTEVITNINTMKDNILSTISSINLFEVGKNMIQGMINGITSMASSVAKAIGDIANKAIEGAKNILQIKSPSRVFTEIGNFTGQGFINGLENSNILEKSQQNFNQLKGLELPTFNPNSNNNYSKNTTQNIQNTTTQNSNNSVNITNFGNNSQSGFSNLIQAF